MNIATCAICFEKITDKDEWTKVEKVLRPFMVVPVIVHASHFSEPEWNWYGGFGKDSSEDLG